MCWEKPMTIIVNTVTHVDTSNPNELAQLALIASDASYKGRFAATGEALRAFDDTPVYGNPQPPFGASFVLAATHSVVDVAFEDDRTGFKAIAFRNAKTNDIILAFGGTDGPDTTDWWSNL